MRAKQLLGLAALLLATISTLGCGTTISPGHVGIVVNKFGSERGVNSYAATTGFVAYNPFTTTVFEYPTFTQTYVYTANPAEGRKENEEITFTNRDSMLIALDANISYHLLPEKVPAFYVHFRNDDLSQFTYVFLRNAVRNCFNTAAGKYTIEQVMGDNAALIKEAHDCVQNDVKEYGVVVEQFGIIGAPRPPAAVIVAINAKVQATQLAFQKQNEVLQAQAEAAKRVAEAEGEAKSTVAKAEGQATANRKLAESLTPSLMEWQRIQVQREWVGRWNGETPQVTLGSGNGQPPNLLYNLPSNR